MKPPDLGCMTIHTPQNQDFHEADDLRCEFLRTLKGILPELREALHAGNWEHIERLAHRVKGSASMFGYCKVSAVGSAYQALWCRGKPPNGVKGEVELVDAAMEFVRVCERALRSGINRSAEQEAEQSSDGSFHSNHDSSGRCSR